ncbi:hypothetical protein EU803_14480 [Loktanella sp. IMCC34160]|nr:hypothetical protein EU803_14480 [Loktanella sp. IMCC34160]
MPPPPVTRLSPVESLRIDNDLVEGLYADLGREAADLVVCRALEDLANRMNRIEAEHRACAFDLVQKEARRIMAVAQQIGLTEIANAASAVRHCAQAGQTIATVATLARLRRLNDRAMTEIWAGRDAAP